MFDMKNLNQLKKLDENAPDAMKAFWAFDQETFKAGATDVLQKQLMAVAVVLTTQCPYCIELHVRAARKEGATDKMLAETAGGCGCDAHRRSPYACIAFVQGRMRAHTPTL